MQILLLDYMVSMFLTHTPNFVLIIFLFNPQNHLLYIILKYKNLKSKHLNNDIVTNVWSSGNFSIMEGMWRKCNPKVDLSKVGSNKKILRDVIFPKITLSVTFNVCVCVCVCVCIRPRVIHVSYLRPKIKRMMFIKWSSLWSSMYVLLLNAINKIKKLSGLGAYCIKDPYHWLWQLL